MRPREDHALVEAAKRLRRPAEQQQERDDREPARYDVAGQPGGARRAAREAAGKGQREHEQREDEVGPVEPSVEPEDRDQQRADRHRRIDCDPHHRGWRELAVQQARLGIVGGEHGRSGQRRDGSCETSVRG